MLLWGNPADELLRAGQFFEIIFGRLLSMEAAEYYLFSLKISAITFLHSSIVLVFYPFDFYSVRFPSFVQKSGCLES